MKQTPEGNGSLTACGVKRPGGGRKRASEKDATLWTDLDALVEPMTSGDPSSPLGWTSKSVRRLAKELKAMGHDVSHRVVAELLHKHDYSLLQANRRLGCRTPPFPPPWPNPGSILRCRCPKRLPLLRPKEKNRE